MSRTTNIVLGSVFVLITIVCDGGQQYLLMLLPGAFSLIFFGWWLYQKLRDDAFIATAAKEREANPPDLSVVPVVQPSSQRLFVPKPLDNNR